MANAGKVKFVKKFICSLLMVWLTFMSLDASAHATNDAAHETLYTHDHSSQKLQDQVAAFDAASSAEASHADTCSHSHCGHSHVTGMLTRGDSYEDTDAQSQATSSRTSWASSHIANDIERPKWPVTTPAVVSLLS